MKDFLEKIRNLKSKKEEDGEEQNKKTALFFGFYFVFFAILFGVIIFGGDRNYLNQEYEKGTPSHSAGLLENSYAYRYLVTVDDYTYDYSGERYGNVEKFIFNNQEYYHEGDQFLVNQSPWIACDNPYVLYEFLNADTFSDLIQKATYVAKTEYEDGNVVYHYLISTNELNDFFFQEKTEYENSSNSIDITLNADGYISKVSFALDEYGSRRDISQTKLAIEMSFEKFGEIKKIDNPIA